MADSPKPEPNPESEPDNKNEIEKTKLDLIRKQQIQLEKIEDLVENLRQLVARLESQFTEGRVKLKTFDEIKDVREIREDGKKSVVVTKYNTFWSERFRFVSAVKLRSNQTAINILPNRDFEGLAKYFSVGDDTGKMYVFLRSGDVAVEFETLEERAEISAVASYLSVYKNESMIVIGHANGVVVMHRVWEVFTGEEWSVLHVEKVGKFETLKDSRINLLEVHYIGRRRYILAINDGGDIIVFKEDGKVHGIVTPNRRPIMFMKQRLLFLTENGAGSLDLRTMKLKESECEGWNGTFVKSFTFDAMDRSKAYGFTSGGDLVQTFLMGDTMNFMCRVRSKRKMDMEEPRVIQAIKGYLLIADREKVFVYNISSQQYVRASGLRLMFAAGLDEIVGSFLNRDWVDDDEERMGTGGPLIASDHEKHVVVSFGNGYVAMYRSNVPVFKNEFNSILWSGPVLFFVIFLFAAWHFFSNKKEALTSWGPDVPFGSNPVPDGAALGSSSSTGDRNPEMMELRSGSGLRTSSRYVSPPRYQGGSGNSYATETDSRPGSVDTRFRTGSELKFRGSNAESGGVPMRKDTMFGSSQVADDGN